MGPVTAVGLVVVAGLPLAFALTRGVLLAALVAPLVTAVTTTAAVILMLVVGGNLLWWLAPLLLLQYLVALKSLRRKVEPLPHRSWVDVLWLVVPLVPPFLLVLDPPVNWDAHSIWWLHAAYFTKGAEIARQDIASPMYAFSHTDYPPLSSAPVAALWSLPGGYHFDVAQFVSSLVTFSAIAMLAYAVRAVTGRAPATLSRLAAVGVAVATWGAAPGAVAGGVSDPLWAAAMVAAAVLLLFGKDPLARPALPLLLLFVAALSKNEAFVMVVVLAGFVTLRERRNLRRAWLVWLPVAAGAAWAVVVRYFGASSDLLPPGGIRQLLAEDQEVVDRLPLTVTFLWELVGAIVALSLVVAVLGGLFMRRQRRELGLASDLWLWGLGAVYFVVLTLVYVIHPTEINWHLRTSANRVSLPLTLLAAASAACWGIVAVSPGARRSSEPSLPAGPALLPADQGRPIDPISPVAPLPRQ
jgi:hypothetical protein